MKQKDAIQLLADARLALKNAMDSIVDNREHFDGMDHAKEACAVKFEEEMQNVRQRVAGLSEEVTPSTGLGNEQGNQNGESGGGEDASGEGV